MLTALRQLGPSQLLNTVLQRGLLPGGLLRRVVPVDVALIVIVRLFQIQTVILPGMAAGVTALTDVVQRAQVAVLRIGLSQRIQLLHQGQHAVHAFQPLIHAAEIAAPVRLPITAVLLGSHKKSTFHGFTSEEITISAA